MKMSEMQFITMMKSGERRCKTHNLSKEALIAIYHRLNDAGYEEAGYPITKERVVKAHREDNKKAVLAEYGCKTVDEMDETKTWACALSKGRIVYDADQ